MKFGTQNLCFLLLCLALNSCQEKVLNFENSEFKNGLLVSRANQLPVSGTWIETKDEKVVSRGKFLDGKHDGLFTSFWLDGTISDSVRYMDGKKHGIEVHYDSTGVKRMEIPYLFGKENGVVREYTEYGNLEQETPFELGVKSGLAVGYYWTGQVKDSVFFKNGFADGQYYKYFYESKDYSGESYRVQQEGLYSAGRKTGKWRENFSGRDYIIKDYEDKSQCWGILLPENNGKVYDYSFESYEYYANGSLKRIERGCYSGGKKCGDNQVNYYYEDGSWYDRAFRSGQYVDGMEHGRFETRFFDETGKEVSELVKHYHGGRTAEEWNSFYRSDDCEATGLQGVWNVSFTQTYHFGNTNQYPEIKRGSHEVVILKELNEESYEMRADAIPSDIWLIRSSFNPTSSSGIWECKSTYCGQLHVNAIALQQSEHLLTFNYSIDFSQFEEYCMEREYRDHRVDLEVTMIRVAPKRVIPAEDNRNSPNQMQSSASCVVVDASHGYLVTNHHAVDSGERHVILHDGNEHEVVVVAEDASNDLALLKLKDPIEELVDFSISTNDGLGSDIYAVGYPLQREMGLDVKVTEGLISSVSFLGNTNMYQISCPITFGNSGGALLDDKGNLAGITQGGYRPDMETENVNGAVKAHSIITLAQGSPECQLSLGDRSKKIDFDQLDKSVLVLRSY